MNLRIQNALLQDLVVLVNFKKTISSYFYFIIGRNGFFINDFRELSEYTWAQLKTKIQNADYDDIRVGDYKTITLSDGEVVQPQIAGIDTYTGTTDQNIGHHIDWISKDCLKDKIQWNTTANNNGISSNHSPWMASNIKNYLSNTAYLKLPEDVRGVVINKRSFLEVRYSADGLLTDSIEVGTYNEGFLWLPSEYEVSGSTIIGTKIASSGQFVQYPLFANSWKHRVKKNSKSNNIASWWLLTVMGNDNVRACLISLQGQVSSSNTSNLREVLLCFRT